MPRATHRQASLAARVAEHLREAGCNWRTSAPARQEMVPPVPWHRPPLFSDAMLGDEPIQDYLGVRCGLAVDQMLDVYERFIAGYLLTRNYADTDSVEWLRRELKLNWQMAKSLFTPASNAKGWCLNLAQFAALVAYNHRTGIEHGSQTLVVTAPRSGARFGVQRGQPISNFDTHLYVGELPKTPGRDRLAYGEMGEPDMSPGTLLDVIKTWLLLNAERVGPAVGEAIYIGLHVLYWRSWSPAAPVELQMLVSYERSAEALAEACKDALRFDEFRDPYNRLKEIFTPHFLTQKDFSELFNPHQRVTTPVPPGIRQKWERAIKSLLPGEE